MTTASEDHYSSLRDRKRNVFADAEFNKERTEVATQQKSHPKKAVL